MGKEQESNDVVQTEGDSGEDKTELRITCSSDSALWSQMVQSAASAYEEEAEGSVSVSISFNDNTATYDAFLRQQSAIGNFGDVVLIENPAYFDAGYMMALPDSLCDGMSNVYENSGFRYGLSIGTGSIGVIYNRHIYRQLGLEVPTDYEGFLENCEKISISGYTPIIVAGEDTDGFENWIRQMFLMDVLMQDQDWINKLAAGESSWQDQEPQKMMQHLEELFEKDYIATDWNYVTESSLPILMAQGKSAMMLGGPWYLTQIYQQNPNADIGWFYLPDEEGNTGILDFDGCYFGISNEKADDEDVTESAENFLAYFFGEENYSMVCRQMLLESSVDAVVPDDTPIRQQMREESENASMHFGVSELERAFPGDFLHSVCAIVTRMAENEIDAEEALELCSEKYETAVQMEGQMQ